MVQPRPSSFPHKARAHPWCTSLAQRMRGRPAARAHLPLPHVGRGLHVAVEALEQLKVHGHVRGQHRVNHQPPTLWEAVCVGVCVCAMLLYP